MRGSLVIVKQAEPFGAVLRAEIIFDGTRNASTSRAKPIRAMLRAKPSCNGDILAA